MPEYTYKDIIIDPTSDEAKNCIGKMVYYADNPSTCLSNANNEYDNFCGTLIEIDTTAGCPFVLESRVIRLACIIPKKEEPEPEFVPFDTIEEFVKASLIHNKNHYLAGTGIWIEEADDDCREEIFMSMVNGFVTYDNTIFVDGNWLDLKEVLDSYTFLDGTPCGKIKE